MIAIDNTSYSTWPSASTRCSLPLRATLPRPGRPALLARGRAGTRRQGASRGLRTAGGHWPQQGEPGADRDAPAGQAAGGWVADHQPGGAPVVRGRRCGREWRGLGLRRFSACGRRSCVLGRPAGWRPAFWRCGARRCGTGGRAKPTVPGQERRSTWRRCLVSPSSTWTCPLPWPWPAGRRGPLRTAGTRRSRRRSGPRGRPWPPLPLNGGQVIRSASWTSSPDGAGCATAWVRRSRSRGADGSTTGESGGAARRSPGQCAGPPCRGLRFPGRGWERAGRRPDAAPLRGLQLGMGGLSGRSAAAEEPVPPSVPWPARGWGSMATTPSSLA